MSRKHLFMLVVSLIILVFALDFAFSGRFDGFNDQVGGIGGGEDSGLLPITAADIVYGQTSFLEISAGIACYEPQRDRNIGGMVTYWDKHAWYDGPAVSGEGMTNKGTAFDAKTTTCVQRAQNSSVCKEWQTINSYNGNDQRRCIAYYQKGECMVTGTGGWGDPDVASGGNREPYLNFNPAADGYPNSPMFSRFEGQCRTFVSDSHEMNPGKRDGGDVSADDPDSYCLFEIDSTDVCGGQKFKLVDSNIAYDVKWDSNKAQCEAIGGAWLDNGNYADDISGGWQCCGDDWIWIYNNPVDYNPSLQPHQQTALADQNELCLYSQNTGSHPYGRPEVVQGLGSGNYRCSQTPSVYKSYDNTLNADDIYGDDSLVPDRTSPFILMGVYPSETDIGKWSDKNGNNPMFCYHEFDPNEGEKFSWISVPEAANKNQLVCDIMLGYNWTGTQCCGPDTSAVYNDNETSCDSTSLANDLEGQFAFSSPAFEELFMDQCEQSLTQNNACFRGEGVANKTTAFSDYGVYDVLNINGNLSFCNRSGGVDQQIYTEFEHYGKCELLGDKVRDLFVCGYNRDSWYDTYEAQDFMGFIPGITSSVEEVNDQLHNSRLPDEVLGRFNQDRECCFFDSCWDGEECVQRLGQVSGIYQMKNNIWSEYDNELTKDKSIFICDQGYWLESKPKFNWYHNTNNANFCPTPQSCFCNGPGTTPYDYSCGEMNVKNECTIEENFFKEDHYCEAVYMQNGSVEDSRWTSRTKMIATQLITLAGNEDYTLYCDEKSASLNFPEQLMQAYYPVNNVCYIEYADTKAIGFSFSPDDQSKSPMYDFLFSVNNGFVSQIIGEKNVETCLALDGNLSGIKHGEYEQCVASYKKLWVNNETLSVIFSKDGLDEPTKLARPDYNELNNNLILSEKDLISDFVTSYPYKTELPSNMDLIVTAQAFDKLYIMKEGNKQIFGFVETIHDPSVSSAQPLRQFLGVHYRGYNDVCKRVKFSGNKNDVFVVCDEDGEDSFVVSKSTLQSPDLWVDLTAKLRAQTTEE